MQNPSNHTTDIQACSSVATAVSDDSFSLFFGCYAAGEAPETAVTHSCSYSVDMQHSTVRPQHCKVVFCVLLLVAPDLD